MKNFFEWYYEKLKGHQADSAIVGLLGAIVFFTAALLFVLVTVATFGATLLLAPLCLYIWYRKDKNE